MPRSRVAIVGGLAMTSQDLMAVKLQQQQNNNNTNILNNNSPYLKHTPTTKNSAVLHPGDKTKPRFLIQLAHFMAKEFRILGVEK